MSVITGIRFDLTSTCQSRGGVTVNNPAGISQTAQGEIQTLSDLTSLVTMQTVLTELDTNLNAIERFSTPTAVRLSQGLSSAPGTTAFEQYLNTLVSICGDAQCSSLATADRPRAQARLNLLRAAQTRLQGLQISEGALANLQGFEAQQTDLGVRKTLAAVTALIDQMRTELNLAQDQLNEQALNALIAQRCQAGVRVEVTPPPIIPPVTPPPVQPPTQTGPSLLSYGVSATPAYGVRLVGPDNAPVVAGPALHPNAALGFNFDGTFRSLQLNYNGFVNVENEFNSRLSQDFASVAGVFRVADMNLVTQGAFIYGNDVINGQKEYLGALGIGLSMLDDLIYPFIGGTAGTSYGGYAGIRLAHKWTDLNIDLSGQVLYNILYDNGLDHQVGIGLSVGWVPVSFLGGDLRIGIDVGTTYDINSAAASIVPGLFIGYGRGFILLPQPVQWGGF